MLAKYLLTGGLDVRLFLGVALYFTAGVFKVKTLLLRKPKDRVLGALYILFSVYVYHRMHIPLIILLPLVDNLLLPLARTRPNSAPSAGPRWPRALRFSGC